MSRRSRSRRIQLVAWWIEGMLLLAGLICLGVVGWNYGSAALDQSYANYELSEQTRGGEPTLQGFASYLLHGEESLRSESEAPVDESDPPAISKPSTPGQGKKLERGALMGRIEIPRIRVSGVIRHGSDTKTLKRAVGHVPYTALPGEAGNVGLAAHRDTLFRNLKDVRVGDVIDVVTPEGTYHYSVESTKIVMPKNVEVLNPTSEPALTLVTCYPFNYVGSAPKRFIVRARQVGGPETVEAAAPLKKRKSAT